MISHPVAVVAALVCVEALVLGVSSRKRFQRYFSFLPPVFWIYFLPMLMTTAGLLDPASPVYAPISNYILPASLVLLLLSSDIRAILRLGRSALTMMLAGTFGVIIGTALVVALFRKWVDPQAWAGFGALSASWTGGSANMIAVKEALATPDRVFTPMVIVDTIVPYTWMGILIGLAGFQKVFDAWNRSDARMLDDLGARVRGGQEQGRQMSKGLRTFLMIMAVAAGAALFSRWASGLVPEIHNVISRYAWMIIIVSCIGIALSFTGARGLGKAGATDIGYYLLYFVLTSIGARASVQNIGFSLVLICAGFIIIAVHALVLLAAGRLIRAPLFLIAAASQANIGGVASAPVVAAVYQPGLASVGLLLAISGNIIGTYVGITTGKLCETIVSLIH